MSSEAEVALEWQPGDVILDLYEVRDVVRGGGMGLLYRVLHRGWNVELAVKAPRQSLVNSPSGARRFEAEAEAWVGLGLHPHVVNCAYVRRLGGLPRVFAEWVEGVNLAEAVQDRRIYEGGPQVALARILDLSIQLAWGLEHAHGHGLTHQDVKPANALLALDGTLKVTDFGLARARTAAGDLAPEQAGDDPNAGDGVGRHHSTSRPASMCWMTPAYCSPEQARVAGGQSEALTPATDVWSWALSVLEMFVGHAPTPYGQAGGDVFSAFVVDGRSSDHRIPALPDALAVLLGRCFQADPVDRPATMGEIADALTDIHERTTGASYARARPQAARLLADGLSNQALSMLDLGRPEEAEVLWEQALHADRHHVHTIYNRGLDRWRRAQITDQQLVVALEAVRSAQPGDWTPGYLLGQVHLERGDVEAALAALGAAARIAPGETEIADVLALVQRRGARRRSAIRLEHDGGSVEDLAMTADGRLALTGEQNASLRVWDLRSGRVLRSFRARAEDDPHGVDYVGLSSVALSADGEVAVSGDMKGTVRLWDVATGSCRRTLHREAYAPSSVESFLYEDGKSADSVSVTISADGAIVVSGYRRDQALRVWEPASGRRVHTLPLAFDSGDLPGVAVSADGRWAISGGEGQTLQVWDLATGLCRLATTADKHQLTSVAISPDGSQAITGGWDGTARLWDLPSGRVLRALVGHVGHLQSVALSAGGQLALTCGTDHTARVWELDSGRCLRTLAAESTRYPKVALSASAEVALWSCDRRTVRVWDPRPDRRSPWSYTRPRRAVELAHEATAVQQCLQHARRLLDDDEPAAALSVLRQGRRTPGYARNRELLDRWRQTGRRGRRTDLRDAWLLGDLAAGAGHWPVVALSADGQLALIGDGGTVRVHDPRTGGLVRVHDPRTGGLVRTLEDHGRVDLLAVSPEGGRVASAGSSYDSAFRSSQTTVRVWDIRTGRSIPTPGDGAAHVRTLAAFTSDGRFGLTLHQPVGVVDIETGSMLTILGDHSQSVHAGALSDDGRHGLLCGPDGTIEVWDLHSGHLRTTLHGHDQAVASVALSADGRMVVSGGRDGTIRVWELASARCLRTLVGHEQWITSVALSADAHLLISGGVEGTVRVWELDWEYDFPAPASWDEQAFPYLELFLTTHIRLHPIAPLTDADHDRLVEMLGRVGLGWLRRAAVISELERMWADRLGARRDRARRALLHDEAEAAMVQPLAVYRRMDEERRQGCLPEFARALRDHAQEVSRSGRHEDALALLEEAVGVYRRLDQERLEPCLPDLAGTLHDRALELRTMMRFEEALTVVDQAVGILRWLAEERPDVFLPGLARSLGERSTTLSRLGRSVEALASSEEAAVLRRQLDLGGGDS